MKHKLKKCFCISTMVWLSLIFMIPAVTADTPGFTIRAVIPENQIGDDQGYYNLMMKNGNSQEIATVLTNTTNKPITIEVSFARATTNGNGLAIYDASSEKKDTSLIYDIDDYVKVPEKEVTLEPYSQSTIKAVVSMPKEDLKGVLAGGFTFKEKIADDTTSTKTGVSLKNEFRYIVALVMQQNTSPISPEVKLHSVYADQVNARNIVAAQLQNIAPTYIKDMAITANIQGITDKKINYAYTSDDMKMAPNSNFTFNIPLSTDKEIAKQQVKPLKPGKYQLIMTVYGQKNETGPHQKPGLSGNQPTNYTDKWQFKQEFVISKAIATKLNKTSIAIQPKKTTNWLLILLLSILICLFLLVMYLLYINLRNKKRERET